MEIKRDAYLNRLIDRKEDGMSKVITGIRRCGKSYLLFRLFRDHLLRSGTDDSHIIGISLDGIENETLRDPGECFRYIKERIKDAEGLLSAAG